MILQKDPQLQKSDNLFFANAYHLPTKANATKTIYKYSYDVSTVTIASVTQINLTEPGGSPATHALGTHDVSTAAGRASLAVALNNLMETLGYSPGFAVFFDTPNMEVHTDFSEIVMNYLEATPSGDFTQGTGKTIGF